MHGLPPDLDLSGFVGRELFQFSVGWNEVHFAFDPGYSIQTEASLVLESGGGAIHTYENARDAAGRLVDLLGSSVTSISGETSGTLSLVFSNGWTCRFFEDPQPYESYSVEIESKRTYV